MALTKNNTGDYSAEFHPREVGPQRVEVLLGGEHVAGSPFVCNVYDVNKVSEMHRSGCPMAKELFYPMPVHRKV